MENKSFWQILKGSLTGVDGVGSNKRFAAFYIITVLITSMLAIFLYSYLYVVRQKGSDIATMYILKTFSPLFNTFIIFLCILLGLASVEQVTNIIKLIRGMKVDDAPKAADVKPIVTTTTTTEVKDSATNN